MPGVPGRSGRPSSKKSQHASDGPPQSPRPLSEQATKHFEWLIDRLDVASKGTPWRRIDGASLATLAELLCDQEAVATGLQSNPTDVSLLRIRTQLSDRVFKFSAIVGLTPRDRERLPSNNPSVDDDADEWTDD